MQNTFFTGEYCELDHEIYVLARVGAHEWNLISICSGQPYSEVPFKDVGRKWWEEFTLEELSNHFDIEFTDQNPAVRMRLARKLKDGQDFLVRVRDPSGEKYLIQTPD